jgi:hypothetical protein
VSWTTSHPRNTRAPTTLNSGGPSRRCLKHEAGIKPGPVHCNVRRGFFLYAVRAVSRATVGRSKLSRSSTNTAGNVWVGWSSAGERLIVAMDRLAAQRGTKPGCQPPARYAASYTHR